MNKQNYTTKETSQAISAVVEVETEKWWNSTFDHPLGYRCEFCKENTNEDGEIKPHPFFGLENEKGFAPAYPAYSLPEALHAIEELGKVRGWGKDRFINPVREEQFNIVAMWQQDGGRMDEEAVSEYLTSLFKK